MTIPQDLQYSPEHEWFHAQDGLGTVGVTAFAAGSLGDIVYVDLPTVGSTVTAGSPCGEIESTKSVSDLVAPVTGTIEEINDGVVADPSIVNADPYGQGWLYRVRAEGPLTLMTADEYAALTGEGT